MKLSEDNHKTLYSFNQQEWCTYASSMGWPPFRGKQIYHQLYVKQAIDPEEMTDLPKQIREHLAETFLLGGLEHAQTFQGDEGLTRKALFKLPGGEPIETVLMVYPHRATVCVSSQAGCPMGCTFCATAKLGFLHDLTVSQIVQQVLWASRELQVMRQQFNPSKVKRHRVTAENYPSHLTNVVFMGMGEPFNNYDHFWGAVERLHDPEGFNFGARNFTVSTVGLVPGIQRLAEESIPINLAVSLHTPNNHKRSEMMPVNRRYPIETLMESVRDYIKKTRRRVSFEYILLQDETDSLDDAYHLLTLLTKPERVLGHINLIPWNPVPGTPLKRSQKERVDAFKAVFDEAGYPATIRIHRGIDINAACGQLAGEYSKD